MKKCNQIKPGECPMANNRNCHTCMYQLDTTGNGWGDGDYYCVRITEEDDENG